MRCAKVTMPSSPRRAASPTSSGSLRSHGDLRVEVHLTGDLDELSPAVGAAIYRIAQESITNAMRHARHATRVDVLGRR